MLKKASIPKGTRDFSSEEMRKRNYVFQIMKKSFEKFGFQQIETPAMENLQTLTGKYGDEGDQLIFKILNSGDFLSKVNDIDNKTTKSITPEIAQKALRYDLTVPFARYVVQNRNNIVFPFRRYQMQNVWRADRPQKGRFREFFQCDADIVGTESLVAEMELILLYDDVLSTLGLKDFTIKINNRKILNGIAQIIGQSDKFTDITLALDKIDKIGQEKVKEEMIAKGISKKSVDMLTPIFNLTGNPFDVLDTLRKYLHHSEIGLQGVEELSNVVHSVEQIKLQNAKFHIDVTLARGLNYYTGCILEVQSDKVNIGSIGGGGRYDNLTDMFGMDNMPGVGISFGFDRINLVLEELNLFPDFEKDLTKVFFVNFGHQEALYCLKLLKELRKKGIKSELYPSADKMKKQMQYADKKNVLYTILVGENEIKHNTLTVKNMLNGSQKSMTFEELMSTLKIF